MAELEGVVLQKTSSDEVVLETVPLGETTQPDPNSPDLWTVDQAIRPPEDLDALSNLTRDSWIRSSAIDAIATNTVGLGHSCAPKPGSEGYGSDTSGDDVKEKERLILNTLDELAKRDKRLQAESFSDLLDAVKHDEEECGQGCIEVSRNRETGMIDGLFHAPGRKVRRLRDRSGWIIGQNPRLVEDAAQATRFYNFGEKVQYDDDGKPKATVMPGKKWAINELIVFHLYTSESRDYGLPRDSELAVEYLAIKNLVTWNASFFGSSGTNPAMLFVQGSEQRDGTKVTFRVPQDTIDRIHQALRSGSQKADKVAIIPLPPGASADLKELSTTSDRDITFDQFTTRHESHVVGAFRLGMIFVGLEGSGRYTAEVQRALTLEQLFDPEQRRYERRLDSTILTELGYPDWGIKFKRLAVESDAARRDSADKLAEVGGITGGELREAHGWPPFMGANAVLNDQIVSAGRPKGAADRTSEGDDQRGQRPGIGERNNRTEETRTPPSNGGPPERVAKHDHTHMPEYVENAVEELAKDLSGDE